MDKCIECLAVGSKKCKFCTKGLFKLVPTRIKGVIKNQNDTQTINN